MNTKERLKEQRRAAGGFGLPMGIGIGIGFSVGFGINRLAGANSLTPEWAFYLIAYGLGMATVFAIWWLKGYEVPPTRTKVAE
jgi:hypothetical protein